jgi:hypothetical protein
MIASLYLIPINSSNKENIYYNNFKLPVTLLIISSGAGPNEIQVVVPGAI